MWSRLQMEFWLLGLIWVTADVQRISAGQLRCFSCSLDFRKALYDLHHSCLGIHTPVHANRSVACGVHQKYCRVERTEVNRVLTQISRECTDVCYYGCRNQGFGIRTERCTVCCQHPYCNGVYPVSSAIQWFSSAFVRCLTALLWVLSKQQ